MNPAAILSVYGRALVLLGALLTLASSLVMSPLAPRPLFTLLVTVAVAGLRAAPVRLSKFSFLTQSGVPVLAGSLILGPGPIVLSLALGVFLAESLWLRKPLFAAAVNAGREVVAFIAAFGIYALVLRVSGANGLTLDLLPAGIAYAVAYFFATRTLFYFTLIARSKLESEERLLILRYEIVSYLLTLLASLLALWAVSSLDPAGWTAVLAVLGFVGLLTKKIIEEAIAAEDLNKVHLMESAVTSSMSLQHSYEQIERLANRLVDWGDFRIYRFRDGDFELAYRGAMGRPNRDEPPAELTELRHESVASLEPLVVADAHRDERLIAQRPGVRCLAFVPLVFGDEVLGVLELEHHKQHSYRSREVAAMSTLATQIATAMHIANLRRPLFSTVEQIGAQIERLSAITAAVRNSAAALAAAAQSIKGSVVEEEAFVQAGLESTGELNRSSREVAQEGSSASAMSGAAAEVAERNRQSIKYALARLVQVHSFVADSSRRVDELGAATRRISSFIGTISEIAETTNLISLNAAIEAARAGEEGEGFAVVADEVRELAGQSAVAAREVGRLVVAISDRVSQISAEMERGQAVVSGVEELSGAAGKALEEIVESAKAAGDSARNIAVRAEAQQSSADSLQRQIEKLAGVTRRTRDQAESLTAQAAETSRGQADLEQAIIDLRGVADDLQSITKHFAAGA